jgi:PAS domain S-box-containing protein
VTTPLKVLYVDDEPDLLEIGKLFLERSGDYTVATCESAVEAMKRISGEAFDVIVSDYMMPECDGIRFLKHLRKHGEETPFIIFTGKGREEVVIEAFENGADFYLQKGGDPRARFAELSQKIRKAADLRQAEKARQESEDKYRILVENANEVIMVIQDGLIRFCNPRMANLLGRQPIDPDGVPIAGFIHPDDQELVIGRQRDRAAGLDVPSNYEARIVSSTGTVHQVLINSTRITWEERPALLVLLSDITARKQAEDRLLAVNEELRSRIETIARQNRDLNAAYRQLAAAEERLRQNYEELEQGQVKRRDVEVRYSLIVDGAQEGIWQGDEQNRTVFANRSMLEMLGYTTEEMLGREILDFIAENERAEHKEMQKIRRSGEKGRYERTFVKKDGSMIRVHVLASPILDDQGRFQGSFAMISPDVAERKRVEKALIEANKKLNLLSSITRHDILNQIMVIKGYLDFAEELSADQVQVKYLETVKKAISTIQRQITFTREYEQLGVAEPVWLSIERLVRKAADSAIPVNCDCQGVSVYADPLLEKVFSNLMDNTLRYAEGATGVRFRCIPEGSGLVITWEDDGPGIPVEEKERIFSRGVGKNTGLGLFLAREILGITGISIRETGEPGRGARFEMTVPEGVYRSESGEPGTPG